jgi:PhoU domain
MKRGLTLLLYLNLVIVTLTFGRSRNSSLPNIFLRIESQTFSQVSVSTTSCCPADSHSPLGRVPITSVSATEMVGGATNEGSIQHLRFEVIEMLRISQRVLDYATKAYESGRPEYAEHARSGRDRLDYLSHKIFITTSELREAQQVDDRKLARSDFLCKISVALFFICQHAYDVASHAAELSACGVYKPLKDIVIIGTHVNSAMRLCAVALIKKEVEHVEQVLREIDIWRRDTNQRDWARGCFAQSMPAETIREQSIATSLLKMMDNLRTIALASAELLVSKL